MSDGGSGCWAAGARQRHGTNRTEPALEPHHVADRLYSCGSIKPPPIPPERRQESEERTGEHNVSLVFCCRGEREKWVCVLQTVPLECTLCSVNSNCSGLTVKLSGKFGYFCTLGSSYWDVVRWLSLLSVSSIFISVLWSIECANKTW